MSRSPFVVALVTFVAALPADLSACGSKFLVPGRGTRFRSRVVDRESATVLLYARPGSAFDRTLDALSVEARLRTAGYRPTRVRPEHFESAFRAGGWDVVVVDLADVSDVARLSAVSVPLVLPVAHGAPASEVDDAKRRYRRVLRSPRKSQSFVEALDELIAARARARGRPVASTSS